MEIVFTGGWGDGRSHCETEMCLLGEAHSLLCFLHPCRSAHCQRFNYLVAASSRPGLSKQWPAGGQQPANWFQVAQSLSLRTRWEWPATLNQTSLIVLFTSGSQHFSAASEMEQGRESERNIRIFSSQEFLLLWCTKGHYSSIAHVWQAPCSARHCTLHAAEK